MFVTCPHCECEDTWVGPTYGPGAADGCSHPSEVYCDACGEEFDVEYEGDLEGDRYVMYAIGLKKDEE